MAPDAGTGLYPRLAIVTTAETMVSLGIVPIIPQKSYLEKSDTCSHLPHCATQRGNQMEVEGFSTSWSKSTCSVLESWMTRGPWRRLPGAELLVPTQGRLASRMFGAG